MSNRFYREAPRWALIAVILIVGAIWLPQISSSKRIPTLPEILSNESVSLLVTNKITTQVVVASEETSVLLGSDSYIGIGVVTAFVGIDTQKIEYVGPNSIRLPDVEIFSLQIIDDSVRFYRNATALQRFSSLSEDQATKVRKKLKDDAEGFIRQSGMMPTKDQVENRIRTIIREFGGPQEVDFLS